MSPSILVYEGHSAALRVLGARISGPERESEGVCERERECVTEGV